MDEGSLNIVYRTSSRTTVAGNSGPHRPPSSRSRFLLTGDAVPYGDPSTFAQKMKNRVGSKACDGPRRGPHLNIRSEGEMSAMLGMPAQRHAPVFDVAAPSKCVADYHGVVLSASGGEVWLAGKRVLHGADDEANCSLSRPQVWNATGTSRRTTPLSRVNSDTTAID